MHYASSVKERRFHLHAAIGREKRGSPQARAGFDVPDEHLRFVTLRHLSDQNMRSGIGAMATTLSPAADHQPARAATLGRYLDDLNDHSTKNDQISWSMENRLGVFYAFFRAVSAGMTMPESGEVNLADLIFGERRGAPLSAASSRLRL